MATHIEHIRGLFETQGYQDVYIPGATCNRVMELTSGFQIEEFIRDLNLDPTHDILPWDLANGDLPVEVKINGRTFKHDMSLELFLGLTIASKLFPEIQLSVCDATDCLDHAFGDERDSRFCSTDDPNAYMIQMLERGFYFKTADMMQGFITGCNWMGVDHRQYWSHFQQYDPSTRTFIKLTV